MFAKISLAAAFFLMMWAPLAGASESARPIATPALHTSMSLDRSPGIVVAQDDQSNDSADSDSDSSDSNDSNNDSDSSDSGDSDQSAGNDQADQQNAPAPPVFQAPDSDAGEAGQVPQNAYPQPVNPNQ